MKNFLALMLAATLLVSCNSESSEPETVSDTTAAVSSEANTVTEGNQSEPVVAEMTTEEFEEMVRQEFSKKAVTISKSQMDSIMRSAGNPKQGIEDAEKVLQEKDRKARMAIAGKYAISIDSLNVILKKKKAEPASDLQ